MPHDWHQGDWHRCGRPAARRSDSRAQPHQQPRARHRWVGAGPDDRDRRLPSLEVSSRPRSPWPRDAHRGGSVRRWRHWGCRRGRWRRRRHGSLSATLLVEPAYRSADGSCYGGARAAAIWGRSLSRQRNSGEDRKSSLPMCGLHRRADRRPHYPDTGSRVEQRPCWGRTALVSGAACGTLLGKCAARTIAKGGTCETRRPALHHADEPPSRNYGPVIPGPAGRRYTDAFEFPRCDRRDHPARIAARSNLSLSRSAGHTPVRPVLWHVSRTSACTAAGGRGRRLAGVRCQTPAEVLWWPQDSERHPLSASLVAGGRPKGGPGP